MTARFDNPASETQDASDLAAPPSMDDVLGKGDKPMTQEQGRQLEEKIDKLIEMMKKLDDWLEN